MLRQRIKKVLACSVFLGAIMFLYADEKKTAELFAHPLKLVVDYETGNFCVYYAASSKSDYYLPIYSDDFQRTRNVYSVLFGEDIYHLTRTKTNKVVVEESEDGIGIVFQFTFDFVVKQKLSFADSDQESVGKVLKIKTTVENLSGDPVEIGLKSRFDISLDRKRFIPLYTDLRSEIASELMLRPALEKDKMLIFDNEETSCMLFLRHEDMTVPASVYCANRKWLVKKPWLPEYVDGRSFRRWFRYDTGLLYVWPIQTIPYKSFFTAINYIGVSNERLHPLLFPANKNLEADTPLEENTPAQPGTKKEVPPKKAPGKKPAVKEAPKGGTKAKKDELAGKDKAYIKALLEKLGRAETSTSLTKEQILNLTKEADDAIVKMREK